MRTSISLLAILLTFGAASVGCTSEGSARATSSLPPASNGPTEVATLAGGCFWCVESAFDDLPGVIEAVSGFTGGSEPSPTYEQVSAGGTGHYETVQVTFDPSRISYARILDTFWRQIDPTDAGGQFGDRGSQYRSAIFTHDERQRQVAEASKKSLQDSGWFDKPIATMILPAGAFYPAGEYHQNYHAKHPIEYKMYRWGSGRGPFIEKFWGDKPAIEVKEGEKSPMDGKPDDGTLRSRLSALQYEVTQRGGTEPPFNNEYWNQHEPGIYVDVVTGEPLFSSTDKFDSGTGWPSFTRPLEPANVVETNGHSFDMFGVEVRSGHGDSHLGHVFADGPAPTGLRYCINSAALRFVPEAQLEKLGYGRYAALFKQPGGTR